MQAQPNIFLVQTPQVVGRTRVVPVGNIATSQAQERSANRDVHVGIMEILFRGLCTVSRVEIVPIDNPAVSLRLHAIFFSCWAELHSYIPEL